MASTAPATPPLSEVSEEKYFHVEDSASTTVTTEDLDKYNAEFASDPKNILAMNVVTRLDVLKALRTREACLRTASHEYSVQIKSEGKPVTAQKSSGRCWVFAALNCMRIPFQQKYKLADFEFSQTHLFFWDKYERANWFLENMIDTVKEPLGGRLVQHLLSKPTEDGGQYDMIVNIVEKYGVMPKEFFPDTTASEATRRMNAILNTKLREFALAIRKQFAADSTHGGDMVKALESLRALKKTQLGEIYRIMCIHLGVPPSEFQFRFRNKDGDFIEFAECTPQHFYDTYVREHVDVSQMISLVNDPRNEYGKLYTVDRLNNVCGGVRDKVLYLNVELETMKRMIESELRKDIPVWFGCHVSQYYWAEDGVMDTEQFDYPLLFGTGKVSDDSLLLSSLSKAERLECGESLMTHAMVFTGVDVDSATGAYKKWRVENSWGDKRGHKGYCLMTDSWFDEFNYQVVVDRRKLPTEVAAIAHQSPTVLPPWDPMGSLAQ